MISTVLVPTTAKEVGDLSRLFFSWHACQQIKSYRQGQLYLQSKQRPRLILTFPSSNDEKLVTYIEGLFDVYSLGEIFSDLNIFFLGFTPAEDIYIKEIPFRSRIPLLKRINPPPRFGIKSGPNLQFFESIVLCDTSGFTLLNETDMMPIEPNWVEICGEAVPSGLDFLVAGAAYLGKKKLSARVALHLNGNGVYNTSSRYFMEEYVQLWRHSLANMCQSQISAAYDVWLDLAISYSSEHRDRDRLSGKYLWLKNQPPLDELIMFKSKMLIIPEICNFGMPSDSLDCEQVIRMREESSRKTLIHSRGSIPAILSFLLLQARAIVSRSSLDALGAAIDGVKGFESALAML
jgi:hypothetical protein